MSWLKCRASYAHGYGDPEYMRITGADAKAIEELKEEFTYHNPDRDDFRRPVFEVIDRLPPEVLSRKIDETMRSIRHAQAYLAMLLEEQQS